jgi:hypothetical protein
MLTIAKIKLRYPMKTIVNTFAFIGAVALLALVAGCASTKHTEQMLTTAGFKVVIPNTPAQEQQIKTLPADKLTVAHRNGKTYYVFPDPAHNRLYVGGLQSYQNYQQILSDNQIAAEDRVDTEISQGLGEENADDKWAVWTENTGWTSGSSY